MHGPFEELGAMIASAALPIAIATLALAASALAFEIAIRWFRNRRRPTRAQDALFVGRWGVLGPELYLVGNGVRRLADPYEGGHASVALALSRRMLAEVMRCRPATQLAWAFASARLEPLPADGFVLSKSDVEAWLDARRV